MAHMNVILTESLQGVGRLGEIVRVKAGFARNFLLPRNKAMAATKTNQAAFEAKKAELEAHNAKAKAAAEALASQHEKITLELTRHASETGQLYGSIKAKDLAVELTNKGLKVEASQVMLANAIKDVGAHSIKVSLHSDVVLTVPVQVVRQSM
jgi:large subunit ribosomal protein L9